MKKRFTGNELFRLRNSIPIDRLIEDIMLRVFLCCEF